MSMFPCHCGLVVAFVLGPATARCEFAGGYRLLSVGVDRYGHKDVADLAGCVADAKALTGLLFAQDPALDSRLLINEKATRRRILEALKDLAQAATPDRLTMLLMSGHGDRRRGEWVFAPYNYDPRRPQETGVAGSEILDELKPLIEGGGRVVLILDACYAGQIRACADAKHLLAPASRSGPTKGGLVLLASAVPAQVSMTGPAGGLFTRAVVEALRGFADDDEDGQVTFREVRRNLNRRVREIATERYKFPGMPWPEQDCVCEISAALAETVPLSRVTKPISHSAGGLPISAKYMPPPPEMRRFYDPLPLRRGHAEQVPGVWYWELVIVKGSAERQKVAYALELRRDGRYSAALWPVSGPPKTASGRLLYEEGKPIELDFGNGYDLLSCSGVAGAELTFEYIRTFDGWRDDSERTKFVLRRVKDWKDAEALAKAR
jgi:hypothetical protein